MVVFRFRCELLELVMLHINIVIHFSRVFFPHLFLKHTFSLLPFAFRSVPFDPSLLLLSQHFCEVTKGELSYI